MNDIHIKITNVLLSILILLISLFIVYQINNSKQEFEQSIRVGVDTNNQIRQLKSIMANIEIDGPELQEEKALLLKDEIGYDLIEIPGVFYITKETM